MQRKTALGGYREEEQVYHSPANWRGTMVGIMLYLDRPIELGPIYRALPAPAGYEGDEIDLFS